jgi:hypothetical protein
MDHVRLLSHAPQASAPARNFGAGFEGKRNRVIVRPALTTSSRQRCSTASRPGRQPPRPVPRARPLGIEGAAGRTCEYAEWRVRRVDLDYHVSETLAHSLVGCLALIEQSSQVRTEFAADSPRREQD